MSALRIEPGGVAPAGGDHRQIGDHLVALDSLKRRDLDAIRHWQAKSGTRFGEAAVQLGLITADQLKAALSQQYGYPRLDDGGAALAPELLAALQPDHPLSERLRTLRTQLLLRWDASPGPHALAVVSTARGEGRSFVAANLAVSFAQLNRRTLAIDLDLRHPRLHTLFGLENDHGVSKLLAGHVKLADALRPLSGPLAVLPSGPPPPNPQELLTPARLGPLLRALKREYEVLVIDTPAWSDGADALLAAAQADDTLLVSRPGRAAQASTREMVDALRAAGRHVVGAVLNEH